MTQIEKMYLQKIEFLKKTNSFYDVDNRKIVAVQLVLAEVQYAGLNFEDTNQFEKSLNNES